MLTTPRGNELWKLPYEKLGFSLAPRPVVGHGMVYLCTSFMQSELLAVSLDKGKPQVAWRYGRQVPQVPSPLLVGTEVYLVSDKGIATCLNALTGEVNWTERIPGNYSSSPPVRSGTHLLLEPRRGNNNLAARQKVSDCRQRQTRWSDHGLASGRRPRVVCADRQGLVSTWSAKNPVAEVVRLLNAASTQQSSELSRVRLRTICPQSALHKM
jgi:hypothetical protein